MTLPAIDNFNRADGSLGSNWTQANGTNNPRISSNALDSFDASNDCLAYWNADSFNNDQYSQLVYKSGTGQFLGPSARVSASNGYGTELNQVGGRYLFKVVAGVTTTIASDSGASFAANDLYRLECSGTSITLKKNGTNVFSVTDTAVPSGAAGVTGYGTGGGATAWDDFEGGNLGGGGGGLPFFMQDNLLTAYAQNLRGGLQ